MTIPGVGAVTALALVALIGDVSRFAAPRQLVGYLGLDGHISRQGHTRPRSLLVEASLGAVKLPGPRRAVRPHIGARRASQIASVATSRPTALLRLAGCDERRRIERGLLELAERLYVREVAARARA